MSDNFNPLDLGVLQDLYFYESGTLDSSNPEDTFKFTLPTFEDIAPGKELEKVDLLYSFSVDLFSEDQPVTVSIGTDISPDGIFDLDNEILGSPTTTDTSLEDSDIINDFSLPEDLQNPGETLFLDIKPTDPNSSINYDDLSFELTPLFAGELSTTDSLYCCGDHNSKYYYDRLDELSIQAGENDVEVGDEIDLSLFSSEFEPVLFLLNQDTGEVIDVASEAISETIGGVNYQGVDLSFEVEDNINYVVSVESALPNQTGEYYYFDDSF